ncbi:MAG: hypothetical protein ACKO9I_24545 [Sphaerospermopsis kisseleviana]
MRSKELVVLHQKISELNTHYSHFIFISEQFIIDNKSKIEYNPDKYTSDLFLTNKFADQFNSRITEIIDESEKTRNFILRSLFVLSYSQFEIYLRDVYSFAKTYITSLPELFPNKILDQVEKNIKIIDTDGLSEIEFKTLEYISLRRNSIVHRDEKRAYQKEIADCIKENGKDLNKFWLGENNLQVKVLDFTKKQVYHFESMELIDILNIIRRLSEKIDHLIITKIGVDNLYKYLIKEFEDQYKPIQSWENKDREKLIKKFQHFARITFGAILSYDEVNNLLGK